MTVKPRKSLSPRDSKEVPQFAPNFTVYVMPPDVVCLYSEHRKFFLYGEIYCALASEIGKGKRSFRDIFRALERKYPADKIQEGIKRLIERQYILPAARSSKDALSNAYWASLGLPLETAERNLKNCSVRIQS